MTLRSSLRALACIVAACGATCAAQAAPSYHFVDLGADTGAYAINNHGAVAGNTGFTGGLTGIGAIWRDGAWQPNAQSEEFDDIDGQGERVGMLSTSDGREHFAYWPHGGEPIEIVTPLGRGLTFTVAVASGRAVGYGLGDDSAWHCFEWTPVGGYVDFGIGLGTGTCIALDINDAGQATGDMTPVGGLHPQAFVWQDGAMNYLGTLPGGSTSSGAAINRKGHVAVNSDRSMPNGDVAQHAALWNGRWLTDLGVLYPHGVSEARALNNHDDVVGSARDRRGIDHTLFLYTGGQMLDLLSLVVDKLDGWDLSAVSGIADDGTIIGTTMVGSVQHGYMLVPVTPLH